MSSYEETYQAWVDSLPKSKLAKLKKLGLDKPLNDNGRLNTPANAEVVFANLGTEFDYDSLDSSIFDKPAVSMDELGNAEDKAKAYGSLMLCWVFQRLQTHKSEKSAKLDKECLLFALGMENLLEHKTQTAIARKYGITKSNVSYRVKDWQKMLGLKPSSLMKTEQACKSYQKTRMKNLTKEQLV